MEKTVYILAETRTNNFNDKDIQEKISNVWHEAREKNEDGVLFGIYHNYAGNYKDDYTLSIATSTPVGNKMITIPDNNYTTYVTERNHIFDTWEQIWQAEEDHVLQRDYKFDFERYLRDGSVQIFIGKK
ncbi:AraC family transcriptional regulator [Lysinibacillus alkalisoli]|uniref:AraC family transcriptional regulator n=1 Tax=Lysinibacillus alkalisoli TaxID=1911548 RepID=A0A917G9B6_9BACI|nr:GyrI-like domain-containing protein [Lysinibacillus alkalisoli]GGG30908.1 AraC family transcriptional regulator [Lysinibacillus alkalisoli]